VDELDLRVFSETTAFADCVVYLVRRTALFGFAELNPARLGTRQVGPGARRCDRRALNGSTSLRQAISGTRRCATASSNSPTSSTLARASWAPAALTVPACSRLRCIAS
jgi:hypothetical protein